MDHAKAFKAISPIVVEIFLDCSVGRAAMHYDYCTMPPAVLIIKTEKTHVACLPPTCVLQFSMWEQSLPKLNTTNQLIVSASLQIKVTTELIFTCANLFEILKTLLLSGICSPPTCRIWSFLRLGGWQSKKAKPWGDHMMFKWYNGPGFYWAPVVVLSAVAVMKTDLIISADRTPLRTGL